MKEKSDYAGVYLNFEVDEYTYTYCLKIRKIFYVTWEFVHLQMKLGE